MSVPNTNRPRVLRIGVVLGGTIVEEKVTGPSETVTVGQSFDNTFSVFLEALPRSWVLFQPTPEGFRLRFTSDMDGRLSIANSVETFAALISRGDAKQGQDGAHSFVIPRNIRGKVIVGPMTLLFQEMEQPPPVPKPQLPAAVRGSFVDRVEPRMAAIFTGTTLALMGLILYVWPLYDPSAAAHWGESDKTRQLAKQVQEQYVIENVEDFSQPKAVTVAEAKAPEAAQKPSTAPKNTGPKAPADTGGAKPAGEAAAEKSEAARGESVRFAQDLFSDDATGDGSDGGNWNARAPDADLGEQVLAMRNSGTTVGVGAGSGDRGTRGSTTAATGTSSGPGATTTGGTVSAGNKDTEKVPTGRISVSQKQAFDSTSLTPDGVMSKIQSSYMSGLKRCHKDVLKVNPTAGGKVTLNFTVNETGRVVSPKANGFDPGLDSCVEAQMNNWRFNIPKDEDGEPTDASFGITLSLQAS